MSVAIQNNIERRTYNRNLVTKLCNERRKVWSLYCRIAEFKPFSSDSKIKLLLTPFTQLLIDYVSLGHFGIFEHLISGTERREIILKTARSIYPEFSQTTEDVLVFNDKYDDQQVKLQIDHLALDLSNLGESLAKRIDLEDKLCDLILN